MANCDYCGTYILFGGEQSGKKRYCNVDCLDKAYLTKKAMSLPDDMIKSETKKIHRGKCPKCNGNGPVDVHTHHTIYSILILTSHASKPVVCCRSCALKSQILSIFSSGILGWWGFPWGIIMTPIQIIRNLMGIISPPDPKKPSDELNYMVRFEVAAKQLSVKRRKTSDEI